MLVSFIIVAYNEEKTIKSLFKDIQNQDYPHEKIEVLLIDGMSTDKTREYMEAFSMNRSFNRVVVKENFGKTLPCGWNVALNEAKGDVILRVDAHASIPKDFISNNIKCIESGEKICGGYRPNIIDDETPWKKTLLLAETSMFGSSIAPYRRNSEKRYVNSVFHGAYSREVFEKVGGYNELLARTEDNEMHYRMRQAGYNICFDPNIISYQHTRNSLGKMLKQKYLNGYWIGITMGVSPKCFFLYHFVPLLFVIAIVVTTILALSGSTFLFNTMWALYGVLCVIMTVVSIDYKSLDISNFLLPILFFLLHVSYGVGTVVGLVKMPFKFKWNREVDYENEKKLKV
ncbi:glycosyl transferase family protein [Clostridium paraputrificum]|uniref:glycosyltransferase family 2 protein n=1 Tax=Clostridium paraputrificum TaxID=29363 RepID=UPI0006C2488C|nr:glycosyltransferase family 2 protein [Clostridium paraputrificum]CUQ42809.1 glycosyl transferase family protein [Clostridium paraputrificum]